MTLPEMRSRRYPYILVVVALLVMGRMATADGSGSATPDAAITVIDAGTAAPTTPAQTLPDAEGVALGMYKGLVEGNWFMVMGSVLAGAIAIARALLKKRWAKWDESHFGVLLAAGMSGLAAMSLAWLADEPVVTAQSIMGALRLFAGATLAYVVPKKLVEGYAPPAPTTDE